MGDRICSVSGCGGAHYARTLCRKHYYREYNAQGGGALTQYPSARVIVNGGPCSVVGCEAKAKSAGLCWRHYAATRRPCTIEGCERPRSARGMCVLHYKRWSIRKGGDVTIPSAKSLTLEERFWQKVDKTDDCWLWTASIDRKGYGIFNRGRAHCWSYRILVGDIPSGHQLHHECRTKNCVRPSHLRAVTALEHAREHPERYAA